MEYHMVSHREVQVTSWMTKARRSGKNERIKRVTGSFVGR